MRNTLNFLIDIGLRVTTLAQDSIDLVKTRSKNTMKPVGSKFWSLAIAVFTLLSVVSADAAMKANRAVVRAVRGTAEYSSDGNSWKKLSVGTQLNEKARIKTLRHRQWTCSLGPTGRWYA
jgi:hypothetical protein